MKAVDNKSSITRPSAAAEIYDAAHMVDSEERYQVLFQAIDQAICVVELLEDEMGNSVDYVFLETNDIFEKQTGLKDVIGKKRSEVVPHAARQGLEVFHTVAKTGEPQRYEHFYKDLGRWMSIYAARIGKQDSRRVVMLFKDITAEKQAHDTLAESEERFRTLIEQSTDAIQLVTPEGVVLYSSDSVEKVLGYTPAEIQGVNVGPYLHPDDAPAFGEKWVKLLKTPRAHKTLEYRVRHKNGNWVWVETTVTNHLDTPNINAIVGNFRTINKRKTAEAALRDSEARLRFMAEAMPQKVYTAKPSGEIDYYSPQWAEYTGMPSDAISDEGLIQFLHPDDVDETIKVWRRAVKTGKPYEVEHRLRSCEGTYHWHISRARPMRDDEGNVTQWIGSSTDIEAVKRTLSRKKQLEKLTASLKEQRAQLIELNLAKDEFISLASHQLRTPATGVKQFLGMVLDEFAGKITPEQRRMLEKAYDSNERQIIIINDLLRVAQVDAGRVHLKLEPTKLGALAQEIVDSHMSRFRERSQKVSVIVPDADVVAPVDPERLRMVLDNVIDNASKYTPEGKQVSVRVSVTKTKAKIAVHDQGVGIAEADIDKLFTEFLRLDNPLSMTVGGTGLGLYWAKKIIDLHQGTITVLSKLDHGSTFTITLPLE